jgi:hypothetical protein
MALQGLRGRGRVAGGLKPGPPKRLYDLEVLVGMTLASAFLCSEEHGHGTAMLTEGCQAKRPLSWHCISANFSKDGSYPVDLIKGPLHIGSETVENEL